MRKLFYAFCYVFFFVLSILFPLLGLLYQYDIRSILSFCVLIFWANQFFSVVFPMRAGYCCIGQQFSIHSRELSHLAWLEQNRTGKLIALFLCVRRDLSRLLLCLVLWVIDSL